METKPEIKKIATRGILVLLVLLLIWLSFSSCPHRYTGPLNSSNGIVEAVSPPPGSEVSFGCYTKKSLRNILYRPFLSDAHDKQGWAESGGVNVKIVTNDLLITLESEQPDRANVPPFEDRIFLYIDSRAAASTILWIEQDAPLMPIDKYSDLAGSYILGTNSFLFPGDHIAKVVIETKSGEILEYEWSFTID